MKKLIMLCLTTMLLISSIASAASLLPSLTDAFGVPMPSLGDVLHRYPDSETKETDGSTVQTWNNVKNEDFEAFSEYLGTVGTTLLDYTVTEGVFTASIGKNERSFTFVYDQQKLTAIVTYPQGTYDERCFEAGSHYNKIKEYLAKGQYQEAFEEIERIKDHALYKDVDILPYAAYYEEGLTKRSSGDWEGAVTAFQNADKYQDAQEQVLETRYQEANYLRASGDWEGAIIAFTQVGNYRDAKEQILETKYQEAKYYYDKGEIKQAYRLFLTIKNYKDVSSLLKNSVKIKAYLTALKKYDVGSKIKFGNYKSEKIEWIVIAQHDENRLLLSSKAIDAASFGYGPWENSRIRNYLNNIIMEEAFTPEEQKLLIEDKDIGDSIFLLSNEEVRKYKVNEKYYCKPTSYALQKNVRMGIKDYCWWGLRTTLSNGNWVYSVEYVVYEHVDNSKKGGADGSITLGIRPAIWVNALDMLDQ